MKAGYFVNPLAMVLLMTGVLSGQPLAGSAQEAERARQLLDSPRLLDKAWGAHITARLHRDDLQQLLIEQFRVARSLSGAVRGSEEFSFVAALFDAAIEAGIPVPAPMLEPLAKNMNWVDPVLILLARSRDNDELLMTLRENPSDMVWLTANNLLSARRSKVWYRAILTEIRITHRFIATGSDLNEKVPDRVGGAACGDGSISMAAGFPPVALYDLTNYRQPGDVLLAAGPGDVYYRRHVVPTDTRAGFGLCRGRIDRMGMRIGYLAELRNERPEVTERLFHRETTIRYSTREDFGSTVLQSMEAQERDVREFLQHIESFAYLGPPIPDMRLQILPEVIDKRQHPTDSLPVVAPRDFDLR